MKSRTNAPSCEHHKRFLFSSHERPLLDGALETIWPTRCVLCDAPGTLLCRQCKNLLIFIDINKTCPLCGSPNGIIQCCDCARRRLSGASFEALHRASFTSALMLDENSGKLITTFKDGGEQRLSRLMADFIVGLIPTVSRQNRMISSCIAFIPSSRQSLQKRGFDHAMILAESLSVLTGIPTIPCFQRPETHDQRELTRAERATNTSDRFHISKNAHPVLLGVDEVILIDDVLTTGATLESAVMELSKHYEGPIRCITVART